MNACNEFRTRLASVLSGRASQASVGQLAWHEHLLACGACRELLQAEEALEVLLRSLPEPHLPPELTQRLLARLEPARSDVALDSLLDRSLEAPVPGDLARSVLARLESARREARDERELDRVLERLPAPSVPARLAHRVLANLAAQRREPRAIEGPRTVASLPAPLRPSAPRSVPSVAPRTRTASAPRAPMSLSARRILIAATILVAVGAAAWIWSSRVRPSATPSPQDRDFVDSTPIEPTPLLPQGVQPTEPLDARPENALEDPPDDLLASLDMLESWELLTDERIEAELISLEGFDALIFETASSEESDPRPPPAPTNPTKG